MPLLEVPPRNPLANRRLPFHPVADALEKQIYFTAVFSLYLQSNFAALHDQVPSIYPVYLIFYGVSSKAQASLAVFSY